MKRVIMRLRCDERYTVRYHVYCLKEAGWKVTASNYRGAILVKGDEKIIITCTW